MDKELSEAIVQLIGENKPETVEQLVHLAAERLSIPENKIFERVLELQAEGKITLTEPSRTNPQGLLSYLETAEAYWFWATVAVAALSLLVVITVPDDFFPLVYIRYVLGLVLVLWLPGYSVIKALFPPKKKLVRSGGNLNSVTRIVLSVGLSLTVVLLIGLMLNYTAWGIRQTPVALSLFTVTVSGATIAVFREHRASVEMNRQSGTAIDR